MLMQILVFLINVLVALLTHNEPKEMLDQKDNYII